MAPIAKQRQASVRVAAVQAKRRLIDWRITDATKVLKAVDKNQTGRRCIATVLFWMAIVLGLRAY